MVINADDFLEELDFYLLEESVDSIGKYEVAFVGRMGMEIDEHEDEFVFLVVVEQLGDNVGGRLFLVVRTEIMSVEVLAKSVESVMAMVHSVRVHHGYQFEHEQFQQLLNAPLLSLHQQVLHDRLHHK